MRTNYSNVWHSFGRIGSGRVVAIHLHHYKFGASCSLLLSTLVNSLVRCRRDCHYCRYLEHYDVLHIYCIIIRLQPQRSYTRFHFILSDFRMMMCLRCVFFSRYRRRYDTKYDEMWRMARASNNNSRKKTAWSMRSIRKYLEKTRPFVWTGFILIRFFFVRCC